MSATAQLKDGRGRSRVSAFSTSFGRPVLAIVPPVWLTVLVVVVLLGSNSAFDFRHAYWSAGYRLLHGGDPYAWTSAQIHESIAFVYPALSVIVYAPFALLSPGLGSFLFTFACIGFALLTLRVLDVGDWRVYSIVCLWVRVFIAWQTANETIFLVFGPACLWRWRDNPKVAAIIAAVEISLKPLMWPLAIWLLATRRWRASWYALGLGITLNLAAWSVIGFGEIHAYLNASAMDADAAWRTGFGVAAFLGHLGFGRSVGDAATMLAACAFIAATAYAGFVRRNDLQALILMIALVFAAAPMLWNHYLALLLVPMAVLRPRLDWLWTLPACMWAVAVNNKVDTLQLVLVIAIVCVMLVALGRQAAVRSRAVGVAGSEPEHGWLTTRAARVARRLVLPA